MLQKSLVLRRRGGSGENWRRTITMSEEGRTGTTSCNVERNIFLRAFFRIIRLVSSIITSDSFLLLLSFHLDERVCVQESGDVQPISESVTESRSDGFVSEREEEKER